ncbi:MAG: RNA-binding protein [Rhodobacteraceae bacterium]|nr:RNA-binding protein [Paracoccaceae bacterium]
MLNLVIKPNEKRFIFSLILIGVLAYLFWTESRYPALDEKAMMSGAIQLEDPLGFEAKFPLTTDMNVAKRIFYSTLNWVNTNKKGMTFGILFAAAFLTLTAYLKQKSFKGGFSNSVLGLVIGTPLGVCVNCAAPIARGMYSSGMRAETTLSAMIASPTLNVVVLTMVISLMPVYMVAAKVGLSLFVILIAVPIICRMLPREQLEVAPPIEPEGWDLPGAQPAPEPVVTALIGVVKSYAGNLWFIIRLTVPLMLLAGFLGAIAATLIPSELLTEARFGIGVVLLVALVGTFLPVPIAFDVVVAGALLSSGLAPGYVMALLFTLGSYSIYSGFIVATTISLRAAVLLSLTVVLLGAAAGGGAQLYHQWQSKRALEILLSQNPAPYQTSYQPFSLIGAAQAQTAPGITVTPHAYATRSPAGATPFTRLEAWEIGIDKPVEFSFQDMWPPFWEGRSLATGDFDQDNDLDLVMASTERGLYILQNDGTGQFSPAVQETGAIADWPIFNAVLVDIDNDDWLDLFIATFRGGNFLIRNNEGVFDFANPQPVKNRDDAILTLSASFGDVTQNGYLDLVLGNWAAGWYRRVPGEESRNRLVLNTDGMLTGETFKDLPGLPGETLTILLSDINNDRLPDLLVGNDFEIPDMLYFGQEDGSLKLVKRADNILPHTTTTTMAIKAADLHNDGVPELYFAQIAGRSSGVSKTLKMQPLDYYCDGIEREADRAVCLQNMEIKKWYKSGNNFDPTYAGKCLELTGKYQAECKGMLVKDLAIQKEDPGICSLIPKTQALARAYCFVHFQPFTPPSAEAIAEATPQILRSNVLLSRTETGAYEDLAEAQGLEVGGWSWDTKIADFDNDGFQDVYIVNGTWVPNEVSPSNLFFRNDGAGGFSEESGPFGLEDYLITAAATVFDMDNDGDLDVVTATVNGPYQVFRNNDQSGNSIAFDVRDEIGNRFGIGTKIEIRHGADGLKMQTREIQLGGGFMSFDAPVAHFGLGAEDAIRSVTVHWSNGGATMIDEPLSAGAIYRVHRPK